MQVSSQKNYKPLFLFILIWLAVNILQACFTGIDGDEAYYWTYSQHLQWGYFDHPPMVALFIKLGEIFGHGYFFTRLGTILLSGATIFFGFKALPEKLQNVRWYILAFTSVLVFHIYSFVTTPDAPLFFFTVLFFYAYKLYLGNGNFKNTIFLAFTIVGLLYSKYHGVLPVLFVFVSNPKLILKRSAWLIVVIVVLAFIPHLYWQYQHDWPTVRYHLFERNQERYTIDKTSNYILGQLLIFGPLTTIVALICFFKSKKINDLYYRAHQCTFFGVLVFFLLSSFKKNIEPHWTLVAGFSFVVLLLNLFIQSKEKFKKILTWLAIANIVLIVAARILIAVPNSPAKNIDRFKVQIYSHSWADSLYKHAAGTPVVFVDNYSYAALYRYYHPDQLSTCYSSIYYRKNNFNLENHADFNNKRVYASREIQIADDDIKIESDYVSAFLHPVDSFKAISGLKINWLNKTEVVKKLQNINVELELINPMNYPIAANNLSLNYTFFKSKNDYTTSVNIPVAEKQLQPGYKKTVVIPIKTPVTEGNYRLIFSFNEPSLGPTFASPFYELTVR